MIVFKPYGHLTKIGKKNFRLRVIVQLYDGYDILYPATHYLTSESRVLINLPLISVPGQIHTAPKELFFYLDNVPEGHRIDALVSTTIPSTSLPGAIRELAFDITKNPLIFGKVALCTEGAEKGKDDREGTDENKKSDPPNEG